MVKEAMRILRYCVCHLNSCMFWTLWDAIKQAKDAYGLQEHMCFGIEFYKYHSRCENNFLPFSFFFSFLYSFILREFWCPECAALHFTKLSFRIFFVFSSVAVSTTTPEKISAVCKIRCLHTRQGKQKLNGLKTCFGMFKVKAAVILR